MKNVSNFNLMTYDVVFVFVVLGIYLKSNKQTKKYFIIEWVCGVIVDFGAILNMRLES